MGRVIVSVAGPERPKDVLIQDLALTLLTITIAVSGIMSSPREGIVSLIVSATLGIITAVLTVLMLSRMVVATFTDDGLVIRRDGRREEVFIPKSVVVGSNVVCIGWDPRGRGFNLRVAYGSFNYTIPLASRWERDRLVNKLREHWGWTPPECPST
jgi:hypothetical protein